MLALRIRSGKFLRAIGVLGVASVIATSSTWSATTLPPANAPLRVVTTPIAPFVLPNTDPLTGFSIDMWNEVARRMHVDFTFHMVAADDRFPTVERG